jgi:hypothetical protein
MPPIRLAYEQAFESHLRRCRLPYIAVDQARRALLPKRATIEARSTDASGAPGEPVVLKTFDFVIYGQETHYLVEVKGRRASAARGLPASKRSDKKPTRRLESWATFDDVASLRHWERLFGPPFRGLLVFLYALAPGDDGRGFAETFAHDGRRYGVLCVEREVYAAAMRTRSPRWRTVDLPAADFALVSAPLLGCVAPRGRPRTHRGMGTAGLPALPALRPLVAS